VKCGKQVKVDSVLTWIGPKMAYSSEKRRFLKNLPSEISYNERQPYRLPFFVFNRIDARFRNRKSLHLCNDKRDYVTRLALLGLDEVNERRSSIMRYAEDFKHQCTHKVYIDYRVINYEKLRRFNSYVNGIVIKSVQEAICYFIICGYSVNPEGAKCIAMTEPPIYS
jgi:hypothetical protein